MLNNNFSKSRKEVKPKKALAETLVKENFRCPIWLQELIALEAKSRSYTTTKSDIIREALSLYFSKRRKKQ